MSSNSSLTYDSTESSSSSDTNSSDSSSSSLSSFSSILDSEEVTRSTLIVDQIVYKNGRAFASVQMDMRYEDSIHLNKYGPAKVDFGGTYGNSYIPEDIRKLVNNLKVTKVFIEATPREAGLQAKAWQAAMVTRVNAELWKIRNLRKGTPEDSDEFELV